MVYTLDNFPYTAGITRSRKKQGKPLSLYEINPFINLNKRTNKN
jgi:hypothetical protein